jgi:hypothetical protein
VARNQALKKFKGWQGKRSKNFYGAEIFAKDH